MTDAKLNMDARYSVSYMPGVAFYLRGYATREREIAQSFCWHSNSAPHDDDCEFFYELEEVPNYDMVRAVMVGDDREHLIDVDDLISIEDDDYCPGCGQIGCGAYSADGHRDANA